MKHLTTRRSLLAPLLKPIKPRSRMVVEWQLKFSVLALMPLCFTTFSTFVRMIEAISSGII